jgi:hypothetical protein
MDFVFADYCGRGKHLCISGVGACQSPELSMREFSSGQIKKGVWAIGFGGAWRNEYLFLGDSLTVREIHGKYPEFSRRRVGQRRGYNITEYDFSNSSRSFCRRSSGSVLIAVCAASPLCQVAIQMMVDFAQKPQALALTGGPAACQMRRESSSALSVQVLDSPHDNNYSTHPKLALAFSLDVRMESGVPKEGTPMKNTKKKGTKAKAAVKRPKTVAKVANGVRAKAARRTAEGKFTKIIFNQIGRKECPRFAAMTWTQRDAFIAKPENAAVRGRYEKHLASVSAWSFASHLVELLPPRARWPRLKRQVSSRGDFLSRHVSGDWGEVPPEDINENEFSLCQGFRALSVYRTNAGDKLWMFIEWPFLHSVLP